MFKNFLGKRIEKISILFLLFFGFLFFALILYHAITIPCLLHEGQKWILKIMKNKCGLIGYAV